MMCQCRTGSNFKLTRKALDSYLHAAGPRRTTRPVSVQPGRAAAEALPRRVLEIERLDTTGIRRNALESLQRVFPYGVRVRYKNGTFRSSA